MVSYERRRGWRGGESKIERVKRLKEKMKRLILAILIVILLSVGVSCTKPAPTPTPVPTQAPVPILAPIPAPETEPFPAPERNINDQNVTFSQLISQANAYNGRVVTLEAFYFFHRSDIHVLADSVAPAPSGEGKVVPMGMLIQVRGELYQGLLNQLYSQDPLPGMSPHYLIHFGKLRMTGKFEIDDKDSQPQMTSTDAEVLEWTPPPGGTSASSGNLQIEIKDFSNKLLQSAEVVSIKQPNGQPKLSGLTDSDGKAKFNDIKQGSYEFTVSRADYVDIDIRIAVTGGRTTSFFFFMARPEEAPDDFVPAPGMGPQYRANVLASEVLNPWPPIKSAAVTIGAPPDTVEIMYRDYIETEAGQTRNNMLIVSLPSSDDTKLEVILKGTGLPSGITVTQDWKWRGAAFTKTALRIEISPQVKLGEYSFGINVEINGRDYGAVPCTIKVLASQLTPVPLQPPAQPWPNVKVYTDEQLTINASAGEEFAIVLVANPRLGTSWYETYDENILALVESKFIADTPLTPVAGTKWFLFKALKSGKTEITLTYKHGDSGPVRDQKVFRVDVK
jgi:predicted secreted protein